MIRETSLHNSDPSPILPRIDIPLERIRGIFLGTAVGDALGLPVETYDRERIGCEFGVIRDYRDPGLHKWYAGQLPGTVSDDTQLTLALADALSSSPGINMDLVAATLIRAYRESTLGWGGSTKESVERMINGVHWSVSGKTSEPGKGAGNGVPMRIAPLAVYALSKGWDDETLREATAAISDMTHGTVLSAAAGFAHVKAVRYCLATSPADFSHTDFISEIISACVAFDPLREDPSVQQIEDRFKLLSCAIALDEDEIIETFGGGSCCVADSLPFTYAFFLRNPGSIDALYEVVNAGGDTDSNAAMLGSLLGALHGDKIFPRNLVDGLRNKAGVEACSERFAASLRSKAGEQI